MSDVKWRRMYDKFPVHEKNTAHRDCYLKWKNLQQPVIDSQLQKQIQTETEKNRALLQRILDVSLHLASRNLPFRDKTKYLDDIQNGNLIGTVELLSHYDSLLNEDLQKVRDQKKEPG